MNQYIIIHKSSDKKIYISYNRIFGTLAKMELSEGRWSEEEVHIILKECNRLRTEVAFRKKMEDKVPDFEYLEMPTDLRFEVFWNT